MSGLGIPPHSLSHSSAWTHSGLLPPFRKHRLNQRQRGERQKSGPGVHAPWGQGRKEGGALRLPQVRVEPSPTHFSAGSCTPRAFLLCTDPSGEITGGELRGASEGPVTAPGAYSLPARPRTRCPVSAPSGRTVRRGTEEAELEEPRRNLRIAAGLPCEPGTSEETLPLHSPPPAPASASLAQGPCNS